jgi:PAS domain S-box-containing protein
MKSQRETKLLQEIKELQATSSSQQALLAAIPDIVMKVDIDRVYTWANQAGYEFFGKDVIGKQASHYFEGEQDTYERAQSLFEGDENVIYLESCQQRKDGERRLLAWWCRVIKDVQGNVTGAISTAHDITERKLAEQNLRESEERFRAIFEQAAVGVAQIVSKTGDFVRINQRYADILGYTVEEMELLTFQEITHPDDLQEDLDNIQCLLNGEIRKFSIEKRCYHKNGSLVWVNLTVSPMWESGEEPNFHIAVVQDITERKRLEMDLLLKDIVFDTSIAANSIADNEGIITHVNPAFLRLWGYENEGEALGNPVVSFFVNPDDLGQVMEALGKTGMWEGEFLAQHRDGSTFISRGLASVMLNQAGEQIGYQSANLDVTVQRQAEEALQKTMTELERSNKELEQFAYVASHDLQEPLRAIAGMVQLLQQHYQGQLDERADEYIHLTVEAATRMQKLINDLLAYSRVGRRGIKFEQTDMEKVLKTALANLTVTIRESDAVVTHEPLPTLVANSTQLAQVVQNLIGNGIKFRGERPPEVHISAQELDDAWRFEVRDNGIGIDPQYHQRIFQIFQRLHGRKDYPGTGMGLSLCQKIVENHGGRIWVESEAGQGSRFYFTIPHRS